jgi:hypothetical protein
MNALFQVFLLQRPFVSLFLLHELANKGVRLTVTLLHAILNLE